MFYVVSIQLGVFCGIFQVVDAGPMFCVFCGIFQVVDAGPMFCVFCGIFQVVDAGPMFCFAFAGSCLIVLGLVSKPNTDVVLFFDLIIESCHSVLLMFSVMCSKLTRLR